jgi:hypothetical protein
VFYMRSYIVSMVQSIDDIIIMMQNLPTSTLVNHAVKLDAV